MSARNRTIAEAALPRRGLSRIEAATYIGIGVSKFDQMVIDGRMPTPRRIDGRKVWDVIELDAHFSDLPKDVASPDTSWDDFDAAGGGDHEHDQAAVHPALPRPAR